ncbi:MAG TPA: group III truncated hemoglobin [Fodinibius sp.]|nr:group III truncated hemoglobin [Fodinibius sp.]
MEDIKNDADIKIFVHDFYDKVEKDERLGYIFNDYAEVDWGEHLPKMVDFWSNVLFRTGRYKGGAFRKHLPLPIKKDDFGRWLGLFEETIDEHFEGAKADYAKEMANRVAASFATRLQMEGRFD